MKINYTINSHETVEIDVTPEVFEALKQTAKTIGNASRIERRYRNAANEEEVLEYCDEAADKEANPLYLLEAQEGRKALVQEVHLLPQRDRDLLIRYFYDCRTCAQIGREEKVSAQAINRRLARVCEQIRKRL